MRWNRSLKVAAGFVLGVALLGAVMVFGPAAQRAAAHSAGTLEWRLLSADSQGAAQRAAAHSAGTAGMGGMMGSGGMGGMGGMMGQGMGSMMDMMGAMTEAMDSPEFKAMVRACQEFMNSPAVRRMMQGMGSSR